MRGEKGRGDRSLLAGGERAASVFDWLQWFGGIDKLRDVDAFNGGSEEEGSP